MSSLLEDLFNGDLVGQNGRFQRNSRYGELSARLLEKESALLSCLDEKEKALYDELAHAYLALIDCSELIHFERGFHMAAAFYRELSKGIPDSCD